MDPIHGGIQALWLRRIGQQLQGGADARRHGQRLGMHPRGFLQGRRGRAKSAFAIVEKHLAGRTFLVAARPTIADFSLAGYVYYDEETGLDRAAYPAIAAWSKRIAALPGWQHPYDMMPRAHTG